MRLARALSLLLLLPAGAPLDAQEPVFRAETNLALVRFHVVRKKFYVDDLKPEDIILLEDGKPRQITFVEGGRMRQRTIPVEMILLFDTSGSVVDEGLLNPLAFKTGLLDQLPGVTIGVYGFNRNLQRFCRPTRDPAELANVFRRVIDFRNGAQPQPDTIKLELPARRHAEPRGASWLYEAVAGCARDVAALPGNATRMILMFSDGFPTTDTKPEEGAAVARELGMPVYPVVLGHQRLADRAKQIQESGYNKQGVMSPGASERMSRVEAQEREIQDFARLGELTGGRSFDPPVINLMMMHTILGAMVGQVRCEYVVGFTPERAAGDTETHKLEVKLRSKDLGKVLGGVRVVSH
jgi:VWFA-related protein